MNIQNNLINYNKDENFYFEELNKNNDEKIIEYIENLIYKQSYYKLNIYNITRELYYKYENDLLLFNSLKFILKLCNINEININNIDLDYLIDNKNINKSNSLNSKEIEKNNYTINSKYYCILIELYYITYYNINNRINILRSELCNCKFLKIKYKKYEKNIINYEENILDKLDLLKKNNLDNDLLLNRLTEIIKYLSTIDNINDISEVVLYNIINYYSIVKSIDINLIKLVKNILCNNLIKHSYIIYNYIEYLYTISFVKDNLLLIKNDNNYKNVIEELLIHLMKYFIKVYNKTEEEIHYLDKKNVMDNIIYIIYNNRYVLKTINIDDDIKIQYSYILISEFSSNNDLYNNYLNKIKNLTNIFELEYYVPKKKDLNLINRNIINILDNTIFQNIIVKDEIINKLIVVLNDYISLMVKEYLDFNNKFIYNITKILNFYEKLLLLKEDVIDIIINDEKNFNDSLLIMQIINVCFTEDLIDENSIIYKILEKKEKQKKIDNNIPLELCDPLYCSLIKEPIELPNKIIMDKSIIKEYLLIKKENPFNREYLDWNLLIEYNKKEDVVKRLDEFSKKLSNYKLNN